ncbi:hypothetical protein GUJ93_ZPchr0001g32958 [Zizania palustris]|uniref:Uncharacterized protein n=1 Tax=Zizania palustris TaxID=103762 RepID=A0A8J5VMM1_ZIZPA|nr:hypothetical protein GUJ93_ZPchr0001g32958 [Zizania palustris]
MPLMAPVGGGSAAAAACKIIHTDGTVTRLARPVRASELMLEHPGQFVCESGRLAVGCRVPAGRRGGRAARAAASLLPPPHGHALLRAHRRGDGRALHLPRRHGHVVVEEDRHGSSQREPSWHQERERRPRPRSTTDDDDDDDDSGGAKFFPVLGLQPHHPVKSSSCAGIRRHRPWQPRLDTIEEVPRVNPPVDPSPET